jgi:hypothetical protein
MDHIFTFLPVPAFNYGTGSTQLYLEPHLAFFKTTSSSGAARCGGFVRPGGNILLFAHGRNSHPRIAAWQDRLPQTGETSGLLVELRSPTERTQGRDGSGCRNTPLLRHTAWTSD